MPVPSVPPVQDSTLAALRHPARLATLRDTRLLDVPAQPTFDRLTALAARVLRAPVALVSLVDADRQYFTSCLGLPEPWASARETPLSHSICQHVVASAGPISIADARADPRVCSSGAVSELGVVAYLGVPLVAPTGHTLGSFCVIDTVPRAWTPDDVDILTTLAAAVMSEIALRDAVRTQTEHGLVAWEAMCARESVLESIPEAVLLVDRAWRVTFMNQQAAELTGHPRDPFIGHDLWSVAPHLVGSEFETHYRQAAREGKRVAFTAASLRTGRWFEILVDPTPDGLTIYCRDITARRHAEDALVERELHFRNLVEQSPEAIVLHRDGRVLYVNPAGAQLLGWQAEHLADDSTDLYDLLTPGSRAEARARIAAVMAGGSRAETIEYRLRRRTGETLHVEVTSVRVSDRDGPAVQSHLHDVTARRLLEAQLAHQAFHDALTGLPNRVLLRDRIVHALDRGRPHARPLVLVLDLDHFKSVNDGFGHAAGDAVLREAAERIARCLRPGDTLARLGGDEFAVLLDEIPGMHVAEAVAERIIATLRAPFAVHGTDVVVGASIGLAVADRADTVDDVLRNADLAMYRAKHAGRARVAVFAPDMHTEVRQRLQLEADLRRAIDGDRSGGELLLYYQPIVHLSSAALYGVEALVRWAHPTRGLVPPMDFIPMAEDTGLIVPIEQWVFLTACRQVQHWRAAYPDAGLASVTVNVSGRHLAMAGMVRDVSAALEVTELDPSCLVLELTESMLIRDTQATLERLRALKALGVRLAIDDFGTGYSSLAYLEQFPIDLLKIDKSFTDRIGHTGVPDGREESPLARAVLGLGRVLGMRVVAEGIEHAGQHARLQALECDYGQGYHFAKPLAPVTLEQLWLRPQSDACALAAGPVTCPS
jgi:diguanylate cyclase (GGDEF)-like protein/PAS domain S-box-containing protein